MSTINNDQKQMGEVFVGGLSFFIFGAIGFFTTAYRVFDGQTSTLFITAHAAIMSVPCAIVGGLLGAAGTKHLQSPLRFSLRSLIMFILVLSVFIGLNLRHGLLKVGWPLTFYDQSTGLKTEVALLNVDIFILFSFLFLQATAQHKGAPPSPPPPK